MGETIDRTSTRCKVHGTQFSGGPEEGLALQVALGMKLFQGMDFGGPEIILRKVSTSQRKW